MRTDGSNTPAADLYLDLAHKEGYRLPFSVPKEGYPWGSTSFVLNNGLIMALAHDFITSGWDYKALLKKIITKTDLQFSERFEIDGKEMLQGPSAGTAIIIRTKSF